MNGTPIPALPSVLSPATDVLKARATSLLPRPLRDLGPFVNKLLDLSAHLRTAKGIKAPARYLLKSLNTWLSDWTTSYPEV